MNDTRYCGNSDLLMSYLYEDGEPRDRQAFEAHLRTCDQCAREVAELRTVRTDLAAWTPPEALLDFRIVREPAPRRRFAWLAVPPLPAWAQLAAASLVVGVAVGISGLEVSYNPQDGLNVRAGWNKAASSEPSGAGQTAQAAPAAAAGADAPWKADLAALRDEWKRDLQSAAPVVSAPGGGNLRRAAAGAGMTDEEFLARIRPLLEASETRLQREMALRLTQVVRDMDTQRRADLARVADGIGQLEGRTSAAVAQQRELANYILRVSQRQQ